MDGLQTKIGPFAAEVITAERSSGASSLPA